MNEVCVKVRQHSLHHYKQRFDETFINGLIFLFYLLPQPVFLQSSIRRAKQVEETGEPSRSGQAKASHTGVTGIRYDQGDNQPWPGHKR